MRIQCQLTVVSGGWALVDYLPVQSVGRIQSVPLRRFAPVGALLALVAVACRGEAVTTAEVAEHLEPTTAVPVTVAQTTAAPASSSPTTAAPPSSAPVTVVPTTEAPVTVAPTTEAPVSADDSVIDLVVIGNELEGGARRQSVPLGEEITVRVSGTSTDHVHVHGYDLFIDLADGSGELTFLADIPGVFEIELEGSGTLLVQMEVK